MVSLQKNADQAIEMVSRINSGEHLSKVMLSCLVYASVTENYELEQWLKLELNGYFDTNPDYSGEPVPEYRTIVGSNYDERKRLIVIDDPKLYMVNQNRLRNGVSDLESLSQSTNMLHLHDLNTFAVIEQHLNVKVKIFVFNPLEVSTVLNQIKTRLVSKLLGANRTTKTISMNIRKADDLTKVFIVHGHDTEAQTEVARFIERLGFNAIIIHEQVSSGMTILEKIEAYSNVGFGVVLYTPCDVGAIKTDVTNLQPRARQNVVFEHGYLIGKLGRENVCALVKGTIETPTDISGVVYVQMDTHHGWQIKLAKEMKSVGYVIDMNKL